MTLLCFEKAYYSFKPLREGRCVEVRGGRVRRVGGGTARPEAHMFSGVAVPGFVDAHLHLEGVVLASLGVDASGARSPEDIYSLLGRAEEGTGIVYARGAPASVVKAVDPVVLEEAAGGRPVLLVSGCGHVAAAGPRMARLAGVEPGVYRGDTITPLTDAALECVGCAEAWRAMEYLGRLGITAAGLMDAGWWSLSCLTRLLARRGRLPIRCSLFLSRAAARSVVEGFTSLPARGAWLGVSGLKLYADGSFSACTAALREPYLDCGGYGAAADPGELARWVKWGLRRGLMIAVHAIGDRGMDVALEALSSCPRWACRVEHCSLSLPAHWMEMRRLGIWAVVQPGFPVHDSPWLPSRLGAERASMCYQWGLMRDAGVRIAFGSDSPVEPPDPIWGLAAVSRLQPATGIGAADALAAYTSEAAGAAGLPWSGRLLPGFHADAAVLSCDPLEEWGGGLRGCRVEGVVVGGEVQALR